MISKRTGDPIADRETSDRAEMRNTAALESAPPERPLGQSRGNRARPTSFGGERLAELEAAIANVTRLLGRTDDAAVAAELVAERRAMRLELEELRRGENVVAFPAKDRRPR